MSVGIYVEMELSVWDGNTNIRFFNKDLISRISQSYLHLYF